MVPRSLGRVPFSFASPSHHRFGDPATLNCSVHQMNFQILGWDVSLVTKSGEKERPNFVAPVEFKGPPDATTERFLVWNVERMTEWDIELTCFALSDQWGQCYLKLPVLVYSEFWSCRERPWGSSGWFICRPVFTEPPEAVSISFVNHTGPLLEGRQYTLQCDVRDVAPVENLTVTFYKGTDALSTLRAKNCVTTPATEVFTLTIRPKRDDDGVQYWCEAKLMLGPNGPLHPPVMTSEKIIVAVLCESASVPGPSTVSISASHEGIHKLSAFLRLLPQSILSSSVPPNCR